MFRSLPMIDVKESRRVPLAELSVGVNSKVILIKI